MFLLSGIKSSQGLREASVKLVNPYIIQVQVQSQVLIFMDQVTSLQLSLCTICIWILEAHVELYLFSISKYKTPK